MTEPTSRRSLFALLAAIALGPVVMVTKCVVDPDGDDFAKFDPRVSMAIALVTVGSLGVEGVHVHSRKASLPAVDELARVGITCHLAFAASDAEPAATISLLTGQLPTTHGVVAWSDRIDAASPSLPRALQARGFATGAFVNQPFLSQSGLDGHFETRLEDLAATPDGLVEAAERWLQSLDRRNFLLWVHCEPDPSSGVAPEALFDALVDRVSAALKRTRWYEGTVIAAAGTRDERGGDLMVPLIWKIPKRQPIGAHRTGPCSTLDITPTILDLLGMNAVTDFPSRSLVTGPGGNAPLFSGYHFIDRALSERFQVDSKAPILGLRGPQFELTIGPKPAEIGLYDRSKAPALQRNLAAESSSDAKRVKDAMIKEMFERKKRIPKPWRSEAAATMPEAVRTVLMRRAN